MKIALFGSKDFDSLEYHFSDSFRDLEHDVFHFDITDIVPLKYKYFYWGTKLFPRLNTNIFRNAAKKIIANKPDLVVCTYRFIHPICIQIIKKELPNIPVIHINPDALTTFENQQIFASPYDFYFSKDPYIVDFMKLKMGLNTYYLPESFNPKVHKKPVIDRMELEDRTNIDVLTFGALYPYRINMIEKLIEAGINVTLFGVKPRQFFKPKLEKYFKNEYITGERKSELLYGAKIVFNNFHYAEIESVNCKFFETAGVGAFQICDYRSTVDEYSIIPSAGFTYNTIDKAIEQIKYYLDKPMLRHEMAEKQYNHFLLHHTYKHRTKQLLETVFGS